MSYRQVELRSDDTEMVCWLEDNGRLREGDVLTLKEIPKTWWKITRLYSVRPDHQRRTWRVGGIQDAR